VLPQWHIYVSPKHLQYSLLLTVIAILGEMMASIDSAAALLGKGCGQEKH
jgi:hypothetical protein